MTKINAVELSDNFLRQRRNVIGVSLGLFFFLSAQIEISTINLAGNSFSIKDSRIVLWAFWLIWLYFLWRYYQYYRLMPRSDFRNAITTRVNYYTPSVVNKIFVRKNPSGKNVSWSIKEKNDNSWLIEVQENHASFGKINVSELVIDRTELLKMRFKAYLHVSTHYPFMTEYHLPFAIASLPVFYLLFSIIFRRNPENLIF